MRHWVFEAAHLSLAKSPHLSFVPESQEEPAAFLAPPRFALLRPLQPFKLTGCKRNSENRVSLSWMDFAGPSQRKDGGGEA